MTTMLFSACSSTVMTARPVVPPRDDGEPRDVDALVLGHRAQPLAGIVVANRGDQGNRRAGPCGRDRLVESLATRVLREVRTEHGLAGTRQSRRDGDEIEIGAADDDDVERHGSIGSAQLARARMPIGAISRNPAA